jgi:hypothetical protein
VNVSSIAPAGQADRVACRAPRDAEAQLPADYAVTKLMNVLHA